MGIYSRSARIAEPTEPARTLGWPGTSGISRRDLSVPREVAERPDPAYRAHPEESPRVGPESPGQVADNSGCHELDRQYERSKVPHERIQLDPIVGEREAEPIRDLAQDKKANEVHRCPPTRG